MQNHRICRSAILIAFLVYAVSPLTSRTYCVLPSPAVPGTSFQKTTIFIVELLYNAVADDGLSADASAPDRILIKKKHALQRDRFSLGRLSGSASAIAADTGLPCDSGRASDRAASICSLLTTSNGRLPISSGLSPPSFS